jgi:hypothetical protein
MKLKMNKEKENPETGIRCHGWEGPCESNNATHLRQNTAYYDDTINWITLCPECMKANRAYWDERWVEYWSDRL